MQRRYFNFGAPVSSSSFKALFGGLTHKSVLQGGQLSVSPPSSVLIQPFWVVFSSGVVLNETAVQSVQVPISSTNLNFTITYRHTDGELIGGNEATLQVEPGFLDQEDVALANGVVLAYVAYTGSGPLQQSHLIAPPTQVLGAHVSKGDGDFRFPPFGEGFLQLSQSPSSPVVTPVTTDSAIKASFSYSNTTFVGTGGITFTAVTAGTSGNSLKFRFYNAGPSQSLLLTVDVTHSTYSVRLATDGGSLVTSTMADVVALLMGSADFTTVLLAQTTGNSAVIASSFPSPSPSPVVYQNLVGGSGSYGFGYQLNNFANAVDITHTFKWAFMARAGPPSSIQIEFVQGGGSSITTQLIDTNGMLATLASPIDLVEASGLTRRRLRISNGTFTPGSQFYVQTAVLTKAYEFSALTLVGAGPYAFPF